MRMRNSSSSSRREMMPTEKEYEVAAILLSLPVLLSISSPTSGIASLLSHSIWGSKRRRSAIYDDQKVAVVNNKIPATTPRTIASNTHQSSKKPRTNYSSKLKMTKLELLNKVNKLTRCGDTLKREVERVSKYYDKLLTNRSILTAVKHQLKKCDKGKTKTVTRDGAAVFPSQQDMSFMYPTAQSCQALPPKDNYPLGANSGLNMSGNGLAIGRAMDPSSWPHGYALVGRSGVGQVNKCQEMKK